MIKFIIIGFVAGIVACALLRKIREFSEFVKLNDMEESVKFLELTEDEFKEIQRFLRVSENKEDTIHKNKNNDKNSDEK